MKGFGQGHDKLINVVFETWIDHWALLLPQMPDHKLLSIEANKININFAF